MLELVKVACLGHNCGKGSCCAIKNEWSIRGKIPDIAFMNGVKTLCCASFNRKFSVKALKTDFSKVSMESRGCLMWSEMMLLWWFFIMWCEFVILWCQSLYRDVNLLYCDVHLLYCGVHTLYCDVHTLYCDVHLLYCDVYFSCCGVHTLYCDVHSSLCDVHLSWCGYFVMWLLRGVVTSLCDHKTSIYVMHILSFIFYVSLKSWKFSFGKAYKYMVWRKKDQKEVHHNLTRLLL